MCASAYLIGRLCISLGCNMKGMLICVMDSHVNRYINLTRETPKFNNRFLSKFTSAGNSVIFHSITSELISIILSVVDYRGIVRLRL